MERRPPRFEGLEIRYIREVSTADIAEITDDLAEDFFGITLHRETFRVAASGIGINAEVAAVLFIVATTASGFLTELGKDAYRTTRGLLWTLYKRLRRFQTPSGAFDPLSVAVGKRNAALYFIFEENLTEEQFTKAISSMASTVEAETDLPTENDFPWWVEFRFDVQSGAWRSVHKVVGGESIWRNARFGASVRVRDEEDKLP